MGLLLAFVARVIKPLKLTPKLATFFGLLFLAADKLALLELPILHPVRPKISIRTGNKAIC